MNLTCQKDGCGKEFDVSTWRLYCPDCVQEFRDVKKHMSAVRNPTGMHLNVQCAAGVISPKTGIEPITGHEVCGLCGSTEVESGYGFAGGYGLGVYTFCLGCNSFLNVVEDEHDE